MTRRLNKLKDDYKVIEKDFNNLNSNNSMAIIEQIKKLKGKAFDGGCTSKLYINISQSRTVYVQSVIC